MTSHSLYIRASPPRNHHKAIPVVYIIPRKTKGGGGSDGKNPLHNAPHPLGHAQHLLQGRKLAIGEILLALAERGFLGHLGGAVDGPFVAHDGLYGVDLVVVEVGGDVVADFVGRGISFGDGAVCQVGWDVLVRWFSLGVDRMVGWCVGGWEGQGAEMEKAERGKRWMIHTVKALHGFNNFVVSTPLTAHVGHRLLYDECSCQKLLSSPRT